MARARPMLALAVAVSVIVPLSTLLGADAPAGKATNPPVSKLVQAVQDSGTAQAALDALNKGLAAYPDNPRLLSVYIRKTVDLGNPDDAFRQAMLQNYLDPKDGLAWGVVAHVHASRGDLAMAWSDIATAVSLSPKDPFIQRTAGELLALYDTSRTDKSDAQKEMVERMRLTMAWQKPFVDAYRSAKMVLDVASAQKPDIPLEPAPAPTPAVVPQVAVAPPAVVPPIVPQGEVAQAPVEEPPVILPGQKKPILIGTPMGGDIQPPVIVNNNYYQYTPPMEVIDPYWPGYGFVQAYSSWYPYLDPICVFVAPFNSRPCPPKPYPPRPYPPRPHPMPTVTPMPTPRTGPTIPTKGFETGVATTGLPKTIGTVSPSMPVSGYSRTGVSGLSSPITYTPQPVYTPSSTFQTTAPYPSSGVGFQGGMMSGGGRRR